MDNSEEYSFDESLIVKYLSGEASDEEKLLLEEKIKENEAFRKTFSEMSDIFDIADADNISEKIDVDKAIKKFLINTQLEDNNNKIIKIKKQLIRFARIAAVILVGVLLWKFFIENTKTEVFTSNVVLHDVKLPDGSIVDLNRNSKIQYFKKFGNIQREVFLTGEAYFKVKEMPSVPFIVNIGEVCVKVLGTSFNIKANPDKKIITVTVSNGRVQFYLKNANGKKIILTTGETGIFSSVNSTLTKSINNDPNFTSWETGIITFTETKLYDAILVLQQQFNVKITLQNKALGNCKITATFDNQTLDSILKMLELSFNIRVIKKDSISLIGEGCL